jgi:pyruvate formate lyase activating enzyme
MKPALFYRKLDGNKVQCQLCPHECILDKGKLGTCGVRRNVAGILVNEMYGRVAAIHYDPIEKKPLYHFYPGSIILSIGGIGCNLSCSFCQNYDISQADVDSYSWFRHYSVEDIINMASDKPDNIGLSFTYNEPIIHYEYMLELAREAKAKNLKTTMVSNGYINPEPLKLLLRYMDAFNIDLKAFRNDFYRKQTKSSLAPVLNTLKTIREYRKHLEITNLVIPTLNDDPDIFREMIGWIYNELGEYSVLHLSRYFPHHKLTIPSTPISTLEKLYEIAKEKLHFVYLGNVLASKGQQTHCPECGKVLVTRSGYQTYVEGITQAGKCKACGAFIENLVL